ncbi:MAG TPA: thioredoxin domain-containing protein [Solirubrobacterales bacterium]|jgi:protein-disulfide isomerase|nr:thioredoxin domain-containing protein [Solirubrobacterales bacterium]
MSNKREREKRREERLQQESNVETGDRRKKLLQMGSAAVFIAVAAVVVLIVVSGSGSDDGGDVNLEDVAKADQLLGGIPQEGLVLGDPKAKVVLIEFGDLQCPVCAQYASEILPEVIEGQIKDGEAKLDFRNFTIIGPQSTTAGAAAIAAGMQNRGWQYLEIFYSNQGEENAGYADDAFLEAIAKAAGVKDLAQWNKDRNSKPVKKQVSKGFEEAQKFGFEGTPSFAVEGPNADGGIELLGTTGSAEGLEEAIEGAG